MCKHQFQQQNCEIITAEIGWSLKLRLMTINWTFQTTQSERISIILDGSKHWNWLICESGRTWNQNLGRVGQNYTALKVNGRFVVKDICSNHLNGTSKWLAEVPPRSRIFECAKSGTLTQAALSQALTLRVLVYWFKIIDFRKKSHGEYLKMMACNDNPTDHLNRTSKFDQSSIPKWSDVVHQKCTREGHGPTVLTFVWLNNYIKYIIYCKLIIE